MKHHGGPISYTQLPVLEGDPYRNDLGQWRTTESIGETLEARHGAVEFP